MLSYLHGIRPNARRSPLDQSERVQLTPFTIEDEKNHIFNPTLAQQTDGDSSRRTLISSNPPVLPPIPRVASQYGSSKGVLPAESTQSRTRYEEPPQSNELNVVGQPPHPPSHPPPDVPTLTETSRQVAQQTPMNVRGNFSRPFQHQMSRGSQNIPSTDGARSSRESPRPSPTMGVGRTNTLEDQQSQQRHTTQSKQPLTSASLSSVNVTHRSSKAKLNRLNPMSLLARRRTAQATDQATNESSSDRRNMIGTNLPSDYDPRIRGNVVHDFSAPRPRRYVSSQDLSSRESRKLPGELETPLSGRDQPTLRLIKSNHSDQTTDSERQHTPVFKEHFGDDIDTWRLDQDDRRNQSSTGIADRVPVEEPAQHSSALPPFARRFPNDIADPMIYGNTTFIPPTTSIGTPLQAEVHTSSKDNHTPNLPPPISPPKGHTSALPVPSSFPEPIGLPKHLKSNASRFSFDLAGVGSSAQEKLLEDKHRQKNAQRTRSSTISGASIAEAEEEEYDYDDMDFDDGLEEKIPGVNAEEDDDEFGGLGPLPSTMPSFPFESRDPFGQSQHRAVSTHNQPTLTSTPIYSFANGNIRLSVNNGQAPLAKGTSPMAINQVSSDTRMNNHIDDDDDLYFDDGMIEDEDLQEGLGIDERLFDDEESRIYGRPLRDLQPLPLVAEADTAESSRKSTRPASLESGVLANNQGATADTSRTSVQPPENTMAVRKASLLVQASSFDQSAGLTQDNLAAYHGALALAANRAAQEGRFDRKESEDEDAPLKEEDQGAPHVSFGELPHGRAPAFMDKDDFEEMTGFGFDDDELDDDAIIAAANAEALENDDEGFYGREFGFFAQSNGSSEADYANGGYFGSAGFGSVKRSHSGRVNGQEPSLTPITERSEWSQRNSMISLAMHPTHGSYTQAMQGPGLAQLADALQYEEDNMSLSALMKLRRGAWGGSEVSLHSNGSHKSTSPQPFGFQSPPSANMPPPPNPNPAHFSPPNHSFPTGSPSSLGSGPFSSESDLNTLAGPVGSVPFSSNPLRLQTQDLSGPLSLHRPMSRESNDRSPVRRSGAVKGHSRESSGAESVSYVEEGGRWVVEKRKMGDGGAMEVLGRQVVEGGRI